jgi:hypothetical protein
MVHLKLYLMVEILYERNVLQFVVQLKLMIKLFLLIIYKANNNKRNFYLIKKKQRRIYLKISF